MGNSNGRLEEQSASQTPFTRKMGSKIFKKHKRKKINDDTQQEQQTPQATLTERWQHTCSDTPKGKYVQDSECVKQTEVVPQQQSELIQSLQKSLKKHCEAIMTVEKLPSAQEEASKNDVASAGRYEELRNCSGETKPGQLLVSFEELLYNMQNILEHCGIDTNVIKEQLSVTTTCTQQVEEDRLIVQVVNDNWGDVARNVEKELKTSLKSKLNVQLKFKTCRNILEIEPEQLILIFCAATTRLKPDASESLKGIPRTCYRNSALLIIHNMEEHALPNQTSHAALSSQEFRELGDIFDIGFTRELGIYGCEMNSRSLDGLSSFIRLFHEM